MIKFYNSLLPIERVALIFAGVAAAILIWIGFLYPAAGITTLFMFGTLTGFWALLTMVSAVTRYITACKQDKQDTEVDRFLSGK